MKWNLNDLYKSEKDSNIQKDINIAKQKNEVFIKHWKENKQYLKDPKILLQSLKEYEYLKRHYGSYTKPRYYFMLKNFLNQTDINVKAQINKLSDISLKIVNDRQFFLLNLSKVSIKQQRIFLSSPILKEYKHFLEQLFLSSKYILSDKEEKIFNLTSKTSYSNWVDMVSELLDKQKSTILNEEGGKKEISYNDFSKYLSSRNKKVRDYASKKFNKINERYLEVAEFEINSILEAKKISDDYRKIPRPDLPRHIDDDIDSQIVDILIDVVTKNFNISKEYYKKKAKLLGVKKLAYHERNIPLKSVDMEIGYKEGMKIVKDVFSNIDKQFGDIVEQLDKDRRYDVYPKEGKSGGAFCISITKLLPTYILLNYKNKLEDVLTLSHESGHAIHTQLAKKQNLLNSGYPTSLAEVASTFFEDFVLEDILKSSKEDIKQGIIDKKLNTDISSIFRQIAFYNFEKDLHNDFRSKGYLSKEYISELFCKHMKAYLGDTVLEDDGMKYGWIYVSHFRSPFYVYSYASGLLISKALQELVREDKKNIKYVKKFMESGSSTSPYNLFKDMGIDISKKDIWEKGLSQIKNTIRLFS
ncbi:MAG: M3 family oligoendopeptidase [Candidatus Dojkabacteria bacterium]|nr:M3 family oligoendopeptidase [Candidatus Dojkabacteria bacterium]